jgi:hypothetical protein
MSNDPEESTTKYENKLLLIIRSTLWQAQRVHDKSDIMFVSKNIVQKLRCAKTYTAHSRK